MLNDFDRCHAITAAWEGGWSDNKKDRGGKTMWGITQATLSAWLGRPATATEIRNLSKTTALAIYKKNYWDRVSGDALPAGVDLMVYDWGVNSGPKRAVMALQAVLGVKTDGWVGEETLKAAGNRQPSDIIEALYQRRVAFLKGLGSDQWAEFGKGWMNRVNDVRRKSLAMAARKPAPPPREQDVPDEGTAKAVPAPPVESAVSTEQKVGGAITIGGGVAVLGPLAGFWRDYKDVMTDPTFLVVLALLAVAAGFLLWKRAKPAELQQ